MNRSRGITFGLRDFLSAAIILTILSSATLLAVVNADESFKDDWYYAPGVLVVEFSTSLAKSGFVTGTQGKVRSGNAAIDELMSTLRATGLERMFVQTQKSLARGDIDLSGYYRITFDPNADLDRAADQFASLPEVVRVEKVGVHPLMATPNDPSYGTLWGLNQGNDRDIDAPEGWDIEVGDSSILVGAMDSGVQWDHADLGGQSPYLNGNIWINWAEQNGIEGMDDDNNGYIDDIRGYDWVEVIGAWPGEDGDTPDNDPMDFNGHGTHTAGTMAAITNNGTGVSGVAGGWSPTQRGCRIVPLRIGWSQDDGNGVERGYVRMDFAAQAFNYATQIGVDAVNCSWGSSNSGGIATALSNATNAGMIVCNSAGNSNNTAAGYLSTRSDVISVASLSSSGAKSSFSNYGSWVDVAAPGSSINSTYSAHGVPTYAYLSGTSMASPHVAGLAGLIRSRNAGLSRQQVTDIILGNVDNIDAQNGGFIGMLGSGRINARKALEQVYEVQIDAANRVGTAPHSIDFSAAAPFAVNEWRWYFGDGDSSLSALASHNYADLGTYDVTVVAIGSSDTASTTMSDYVIVHADTLEFVDFVGGRLDPLYCEIRLRNIAPIKSLDLPIHFPGNMNIDLESISSAGMRAEHFELVQVQMADPGSYKMHIRMVADIGGGTPPLPAGDGTLLRINFVYNSPPPVSGFTLVDTTRFDSFVFSAVTSAGAYVPTITSGTLQVNGGVRGDADGNFQLTIADPVFLINYVFAGGPAPALYNGDADSSGAISIADAVFLINFIFGGGPPPGP